MTAIGKEKLEGELRRLAETAAATGPSAFLVAAINTCPTGNYDLSASWCFG
jgi:hypothetical protein